MAGISAIAADPAAALFDISKQDAAMDEPQAESADADAKSQSQIPRFTFATLKGPRTRVDFSIQYANRKTYQVSFFTSPAAYTAYRTTPVKIGTGTPIPALNDAPNYVWITGTPSGRINTLGGADILVVVNATASVDADMGAGDDIAIAAYGNDTLLGGDGADYLDGNQGHDSLSGGKGNDTLIGGFGDDTLQGGDDDDLLKGDNGNDRLQGDKGDDALAGGAGNDALNGGPGNDSLFGNTGEDELHGDKDNDALHGGEGNDMLWGDAGDDTLWGDDGDDTLIGGTGLDYLYGGSGADVFVFSPSDYGGQTHVNMIGDFQLGLDRIDLSAFNLTIVNGTIKDDRFSFGNVNETACLIIKLDANASLTINLSDLRLTPNNLMRVFGR